MKLPIAVDTWNFYHKQHEYPMHTNHSSLNSHGRKQPTIDLRLQPINYCLLNSHRCQQLITVHLKFQNRLLLGTNSQVPVSKWYLQTPANDIHCRNDLPFKDKITQFPEMRVGKYTRTETSHEYLFDSINHPMTTLSLILINQKPSFSIVSMTIPLESARSKFANWNLQTNRSLPIKQIYLILFWMTSGDVQCNPGQTIPFCSICECEIRLDSSLLQCFECNRWTRAHCEGVLPTNQSIQGKIVYLGVPSLLSP